MHFLDREESPQTAFWITDRITIKKTISSGCNVRWDGKIYADFEGSSIGKIYIVHNSEKWFNHKQRKTTEFCFPGCFRAGDRILLADDSNEDWWKVGTNPIPSPSCNFKTLLKYHKQSLKQFE